MARTTKIFDRVRNPIVELDDDFPEGQRTEVVVANAVPIAVDATVEVGSVAGEWTDRSGTIVAGSTSQLLMAANPDRKGWVLQNVSTRMLWFNFTANATLDSPSFSLSPGQSYWELPLGVVSLEQVNVVGDTTGQAYTAKEF